MHKRVRNSTDVWYPGNSLDCSRARSKAKACIPNSPSTQGQFTASLSEPSSTEAVQFLAQIGIFDNRRDEGGKRERIFQIANTRHVDMAVG